MHKSITFWKILLLCRTEKEDIRGGGLRWGLNLGIFQNVFDLMQRKISLAFFGRQ